MLHFYHPPKLSPSPLSIILFQPYMLIVRFLIVRYFFQFLNFNKDCSTLKFVGIRGTAPSLLLRLRSCLISASVLELLQPQINMPPVLNTVELGPENLRNRFKGLRISFGESLHHQGRSANSTLTPLASCIPRSSSILIPHR